MSLPETPVSRSWIASDRPIPRLIARPLRQFLATEVSGGIILMIATAVALLWANSPLQSAYDALWGTELSLQLGGLEITEDLRHWVNDALMVIFFFVVGLEIKRELVAGELQTLRKAALLAVAALGGMVVPALLYVAFNAGSATVRGWGIAMATDIAFALGVLALLGPRVPSQLKVFLLTIAIVDDIGAIIVIALFYSSGISLIPLAVAVALLVATAALRRLHVRWMPLYVAVGVLVWLATFESGIHATIAGVALGLMTPAKPLLPEAKEDEGLPEDEVSPSDVREEHLRTKETVSPAERLEHTLHPWTSFAIVPLFALANAGVQLDATVLRSAMTSPVTLGIVVGLVAGKLIGISTFTWGAARSRLVRLPEGMTFPHVTGLAGVAGIGFTVSLFIAGLAFDDAPTLAEAKVGILGASLVAAILGAIRVRATLRRADDKQERQTGA